jgi:hypothetical protein
MSLLETVLKVLMFFLFLLCFNDFGWRAFAIGLGICVSDMNVKDGSIPSSSPKTLDQEIPSFILGGSFGSLGGQNFLILSNTTGANKGFITYF